ncbi:hypothetical protein Goshw_009710 [Gossypium schwendimanii]|uniref:Uncharacterized protein n=1 Tax=Gossypium schwendimanii TaxID=34291 RepID=A0A7J9MSW3_GOSSC|nr:hypothetical protein [Gossypium schwendimanii]
MKRCVSGQKVRIFFPHLVMALCKSAGVPMASIEQSMKPSRSIISDAFYTQYTELQTKQMKEWNKRQQEKMASLASSKRKAKSTALQEIGENSHLKLDCMIHWMQESGPIF